MAKERLDKLAALALGMTRSEARELIKKGGVCVNGAAVCDGALKIDSEIDEITVSGQRAVPEKTVYIMLNKPKGVISASYDGKEKTVVDILPDSMKRRGLFPAGRLDKDTTGFCLITDDGDFAHYILSPVHHIKKTYLAVLSSDPGEQTVKDAFSKGVILKDGTVLLSAQARLVSGGCQPVYEVVISEGKYHQVKRMFASLGTTVTELKRIKMGGLFLDESLAPGEARYLTADELSEIKSEK